MMRKSTWLMVLLISTIVGLSGCGGGGGSSSSNPSGSTVTVSGSVVNGPLVGATVFIYAADGTLLGQALTDGQGFYGLDGLTPSDSYRVTASGGTLDGAPYPGTLSGQCSVLPCDITPLTTLIDQLADQEDITYGEANTRLLNWLALDTDPFMADHQGTPVAGVDLAAVREALLDQPGGVDDWISAVLAAFSSGIHPWETWMGVPTVTSPTGKVWMDRNLGASQVAAAYNDSAAYGDLYQWGRGTDGHEKRTSLTTTALSDSDTPGHGNFILAPDSPYDWRSPQNDTLWQGVSGTNNPCPSGFRLPTNAEWQAELTALSITNSASAFASPLKLVSAGLRSDLNVGAIYFAGSVGYYWGSSVHGTGARYLRLGSSYAYTSSSSRANGFSVRCLEDTFIPPTDHVAVNFIIDDTANRSYLSADGLAWKGSFSFDPVTRILTYAAAWPGPYPMMYDDGPWSSGGHEPLGSVAGDNIWGVTVWVPDWAPTTTTQSFEYGAIEGSVNGSDGSWIWIGPNETFTVTSGATVPIDARGLVIPID